MEFIKIARVAQYARHSPILHSQTPFDPFKAGTASRRQPDEGRCVLLPSDQIFCVSGNKLTAELLRSALKPESWFLITERGKRAGEVQVTRLCSLGVTDSFLEYIRSPLCVSVCKGFENITDIHEIWYCVASQMHLHILVLVKI